MGLAGEVRHNFISFFEKGFRGMAVSKNGKTKTTKRTTAKAKTAAPKNRVKQHIPEPVGKRVEIAPLRIGMAKVQLTGTSPLVTNPFGEKARRELLEAQTGHKSTTKSKRSQVPRRGISGKLLRS